MYNNIYFPLPKKEQEISIQFNSRFQFTEHRQTKLYVIYVYNYINESIKKRKHSKFLVYLLKTYLDNNKYFFFCSFYFFFQRLFIFYKFISHCFFFFVSILIYGKKSILYISKEKNVQPL